LLGRHGVLDLRPARRALPERGPLRGPLPRRGARDRRARRDPPRGLKRGPQGRPDGRRARAQGRALRALEEPENLTRRQKAKLSSVQQTNQRLYRAYLLKEQLREIYRVPAEHAGALLDAWLQWARRSRLQPFVKLARTIKEQRPGIEAAIENGLANARVEAANTKIRLITRRAFGFHSPNAPIALAMLTLGRLCPTLPGRLT